jgi:hypothetical protein
MSIGAGCGRLVLVMLDANTCWLFSNGSLQLQMIDEERIRRGTRSMDSVLGCKLLTVVASKLESRNGTNLTLHAYEISGYDV